MRDSLDEAIASAFGAAVSGDTPVGGGCIHDARRIDLADGRRLFVKSADSTRAGMLAAEAASLHLLAPHIRVPSVLKTGETRDGGRWLALEWLDLHPAGSPAKLGAALAGTHAIHAGAHGLDHDNFIGATPQENDPMAEWRSFYIHRRLRSQLEAARRNGHALPDQRILDAAERLLEHHSPSPALLHGDLWSGNVAALADGTPVVFDPAAYFGDPETDLAMLELFGAGLGREFFAGYGPEPDGRAARKPLYDLYHALNHLQLFGGGYVGMVRGCLERLGIR